MGEFQQSRECIIKKNIVKKHGWDVVYIFFATSMQMTSNPKIFPIFSKSKMKRQFSTFNYFVVLLKFKLIQSLIHSLKKSKKHSFICSKDSAFNIVQNDNIPTCQIVCFLSVNCLVYKARTFIVSNTNAQLIASNMVLSLAVITKAFVSLKYNVCESEQNIEKKVVNFIVSSIFFSLL